MKISIIAEKSVRKELPTNNSITSNLFREKLMTHFAKYESMDIAFQGKLSVHYPVKFCTLLIHHKYYYFEPRNRCTNNFLPNLNAPKCVIISGFKYKILNKRKVFELTILTE